jgi:hypothetical protein
MTRRARPVLKTWRGAMVAALLLSAQLAAAQGTDVCVYLTGGNGKVSGLQMDLGWDPACMTANSASGNAAQCSAASSTGKSVQTALLSDSSLRVFFLSFSDTKPIPDGGLFCCQFTMVGSQTGSCCSVGTGNVIFSDAKGKRVYDPSAKLSVVVGGGAPCITSSAGGSENNPVRPGVPPAAVGQPPVVSAPVEPAAPAAPAAPAPGALPPVMPRPNLPAEVPAVQGLPAEAPPAGLAPTEGAPSPVVTAAAAKTPTVATTAARTPTVPTATTPQRTPEAQGTATQALTPATAAPTTAAPAKTPTPKPKHKKKAHRKRSH